MAAARSGSVVSSRNMANAGVDILGADALGGQARADALGRDAAAVQAERAALGIDPVVQQARTAKARDDVLDEGGAFLAVGIVGAGGFLDPAHQHPAQTVGAGREALQIPQRHILQMLRRRLLRRPAFGFPCPPASSMKAV